MSNIPIPPNSEPLITDKDTSRANDNWYRYWDGVSKEIASVSSAALTASTYAQTILASTTASVARTALGLGTAAVEASTKFTINAGATVAAGTGTEFNVSTGIPADVQRVTVAINGVSLDNTAQMLVQIGTTSGFVTAAYDSAGCFVNTSAQVAGARSSVGFLINTNTSNSAISGTMTLTRVSSNNAWVESHVMACTLGRTYSGGGTVSLGGALDRVRVLSNATGTNNFDAGEASVFWEF